MNDRNWNDLRRALAEKRIGRRRFLEGAALLGVSTALATSTLAKAGFAATPKKGGTLRLGIGGGSTTDSLDPRTYTDTCGIVFGASILNHLIEIDTDKKPAPVLFESWEAEDKATRWVFNIRKGVTFHDGKTLDADDIIYSINLHRGKDSQSGAAENLAAIKEIKKANANQIEILLESGDADFDYVLSDYHILAVPNGFQDWAKPIGTGAYRFESWDPGVSARGVRNDNYWRSDRGFVDAIELTVINDTPARMNALVAGQVDAINRVDTSTIDLLTAAPDLEIVRSPGGYHVIFAMRTDMAPFDNADLRQAMKHAINREQLLKSLFNDFGTVGNDHPIPSGDPYYNSELPQTKYDPEKARFFAKKAGLSGPVPAPLSTSDAAFLGAVDAASVFQANAAAAGVNFQTKKESNDGFWDNVWLKAPFCESYWVGRPAATQMLTVAYKSTAAWNETGWKNQQFDKWLAEAKAEVDPAKRKPILWDLQKMLHEDGGAIIPMFKDYVEAHSKKVKGHTPHSNDEFDNNLIAEKAWIEE